MISFKELKILITKCCKVESRTELSERFSFEVNFENMEKRLQAIDPNLHVLSFSEKTDSYVPDTVDIQLITEYIHTSEELYDALNGSTEMASFMIFSTMKSNGKEYNLIDDDENVIPREELFKVCNIEGSYNHEVVKEIIAKLPIYQIVVIRTFNKKQDRFEYKMYFRSNYEMVSLFKYLCNKESEEVTDSVEKSEE